MLQEEGLAVCIKEGCSSPNEETGWVLGGL